MAPYPSQHARELSVLLRISRDLDIVGDVTATVEDPSELVAWANILADPVIAAWRATDSHQCYVQVAADHGRAPIHGRVAAVLRCDRHTDFWNELLPKDLTAGEERALSLEELSTAWAAMPITPPSEL